MDENTINMEESVRTSPSAGDSLTVPNNRSSAEEKIFQNIVVHVQILVKNMKLGCSTSRNIKINCHE
jgi:hypothetical protein